MRVSVLGFGSVWRRRLGKDPADPKRFARAAYFNTTGVIVKGLAREDMVIELDAWGFIDDPD